VRQPFYCGLENTPSEPASIPRRKIITGSSTYPG